jgi:hypothetical protein
MAKKSIGLLNIVFGADLRGFERAMKKAQRSIKKFGTKLGRVGKNLTRNLTAPLAAFAAVSVKNFDTQIKAETKLLVALKGREDIQKRLITQAKELQTQTLFGDEATIEAQAMLASLGLTEDQIVMLMPQIQNMATGLGMDLVGATSLVSKSVSTTTDALARYFNTGLKGVTGQQERAIVLTQALTDKFDGQAEAAAKVGMGSLIQLKNILGDITEDIGRLVLPHIIVLAEKLKKLALKFNTLSEETKKNILKWGGFAFILGPVIVGVSKLVLAFGYLLPLIFKIGRAIRWLSVQMLAMIKKNPWLLLATAVAAVGVTIADSMGAFDKWLGKTDDIEDETEDATKGVDDLTAAFGDLDNQLQSKSLQEILDGLGDLEEEAKGVKETLTALPSLGPTLMPVKEGGPILPKDWVLTDILNKQKELNAVTALFGDVMHNAMMDAANSQEGFFKSFIENLKRALKQLLLQLAVMTAINMLLGGKGMTGVMAFNQAKAALLGLQHGGLATGPTMALVGEGSGTSISNPEVIAPLDKLKNYMGGGDMRVVGRLVGNDIFLSNEKTGTSRNRYI